ncbi:hypothetical protein D9M72_305090 [compost metagenome]
MRVGECLRAPLQVCANLAQRSLRRRGRIEQVQVGGEAGVEQPLAVGGNRACLFQRGVLAGQACGAVQQRVERIEQRLGVMAQLLGAAIGALVGQQLRGQARERMRGQAVETEALAHRAVHAVREIALTVPGGQRRQALAQRRPRVRYRRQRRQSSQQCTHAVAECLGHCRHRDLERVDTLLVRGQRLGHLRAARSQRVAVMRLRDPLLVAGAQVGNEGFLVGRRVMDQAAQRVQPALLEPMEHHVERGALFADEQHALAAAGVVGNQVGDGLRLARARRALDDKAALAARQANRCVLGRVGRHHVPLLGRCERCGRLGLHVARIDREYAVERPIGAGLVQQLRVVAHQRHLAVVEVGERHLRQVQVPGITVAFGLLQHVALALFALRGGGAAHVGLARTGGGCGARFEALRQFARPHPMLEQRAAQRPVVVLRIAVRRQPAAAARGGRARPAALELLHPLQRLLPHQPHRGLVDQAQLDRGLGAANLREDARMDLRDRGLVEIHGLVQPDVVQLVQVMAQHRVELGLAARALDHILVAYALAFDQLHRQPQQRRHDALVRRLLQVVPAQERHHQAQVAEAVFGAVAAGLGDQAVERRRQVGLVVEAQPLLQRYRLARHQVGRERSAPGADVLGPHAFDLQHQRHAGHGDVDGGRGRPEVQQAVAPREIEQAVAQVREHGGAARRGAGRAGQCAFNVQSQRLLAPRAQPGRQRGDIGGAVVAVDLGHLDDHRRDDRMQALVQQEQVAALRDETAQVVLIGKVQAAGEAREHHAEQEHVADLVVVAKQAFPAGWAA